METNINLLQGCLIVTIPGSLSAEMLSRIEEDVQAHFAGGGIHGVLFDMSAVYILDSSEFLGLLSLAAAVRLLGAESAFLGFRPGVVSVIVDFSLSDEDFRAFRTMDSALAYLAQFGPGNEHSVPVEDEALQSTRNEETEGVYDSGGW